MIGRPDVELVVRSGTMRELLAQLEMHGLDVVLATTAVRRDAGTDLHSHLIAEQPVSLVGRSGSVAEPLRFPDALRTVPVTLPSLDSEIRVALDRVLSLAGIHPIFRPRSTTWPCSACSPARARASPWFPRSSCRTSFTRACWSSICRIPDVTERFYAIVQTRRFPKPVLQELIAASVTPPAASATG